MRHIGLVFIAIFTVILFTEPAYAGNVSGIFNDIGTKLWDIGISLINNVGKGAVLVGGAWAVLAYIGQVSGMSQAVMIFVAGLFLSFLPTLVQGLF